MGFCDVDWAFDPDDRRSTTGYYLYLGSNMVSWSSKKQPTISRSSTKAKYCSLANLVVEVTLVQLLLQELGVVSTKTSIIWCDNLSVVMLAASTKTNIPVLHARTKYIELDLYFVQEKVAGKTLEVRHVPI